MTESVSESSATIPSSLIVRKSMQILHVDDDPSFLKVAKQCLDAQGEFEVETASSVNEALEKLKKTDYDAIVSDYQMPDQDGLEFLKELRGKGNTVPFIVFTGKGREEVAIKALNLGADQYIDKHGDPETVYCELAHAIRQATDRKSKDIELFEKEARLQAVLESSPDAITVSDLNGNVIQCNKATLDMLGFSSKDELIGKNGYELIAEKDRQKATENLKKTLDQGSVRNIEYAFLARDGHEFPTELSASVLRDSSGKVVGFVSVAKNISERKKAEEELRTQREELQVILDSMPAKIWYKDRNNRLVRVNKAFAEYMGVSKENLEGKPLCDLFPPDIAQKCWEEDKEVITTGQPKTDILDRHESAQGVRWFSTGKVPCREKDGNIIGTINFSVDITERRKAEEALRKSEEKYRLFVQNLQGIAYRGDTGFNADFFNGPVKEITGYSEEELLKGKIKWDKLIHEEDSAGILNCVKESISNKQKSGRMEYRIVRKDGTVKWIRQMLNHLFDDSGEVTGSQGILYDITEEKKTEEALRESLESYKELAESISDVFFAMDKDSRYTYWNKASEKLTGITEKDAIGKSLTEVFPDVKGTKVEQFYREVLRTKQSQSYLNKYQVGGKDYVFEINAYPTKAGLSVFVKNITERKKMEEEIKSLARFPSENPNPVLRVSQEGIVLYANNPGKALLQDWEREVVAPTPEFLRKVVAETFSNQSGKNFDLNLGEQVYSITVTPVMGSGYANIYGIDITERKKAEEITKKSNEELKETFDAISDFVFVLDTDFRLAKVNKAMCDALKKEPGELVGKRCYEVLHGIDEPWPNCPHKKTLSTGQAATEEVNDPHLGCSLLVTNSPIRDCNGKLVGAVHIAKDITERKKAEEDLKSSEQKFRGLVEDSAAAIATIDLKGRLTYVNRALADSLGYSIQEMSGRAFKDFVHPDDRGKLVRLFLKIIVLRRKPRKFEFRALRKDGGILHLVCKPTRLEIAGKTVGFQAIIMDSTAEKRMLERAEEISEKLSVVGGLTRHDVNNKLSTILSVSYLLKQRLRDNQSLELVKETESAVHQIEGLFEFARTYEKLGTEELAYVDAEKVFNEAARLFPSLKDIRIVNDCHGLTLFADSLLRQLFYNLIDNSLKHGEKASQVRVHYQTREDQLKLIYEDDGIGIPKAEKDKIFKEGHGKDGGHGLYLMKKMCEVYGWTIQETGRQGKGAQFTIDMPKAKPDGRLNYRLN